MTTKKGKEKQNVVRPDPRGGVLGGATHGMALFYRYEMPSASGHKRLSERATRRVMVSLKCPFDSQGGHGIIGARSW